MVDSSHTMSVVGVIAEVVVMEALLMVIVANLYLVISLYLAL